MGRTRLAFVAGILMVSLVPAGQALAEPVECGAVITTDSTLDHDLQCTGNGVLVGADDVTLNLNGHTIAGPGAGSPGRAGVSSSGDHDGISVRNGTITDYAVAVAPWGSLRETTRHRVRGLRTERTFAVISLNTTRDVRIERSDFADSQYGIFLSGAARETVIGRNTFSRVGIGLFPLSSGFDDSTVVGNRFDLSAGGGIRGDRNRILNNRLVDALGGFGATGVDNVVQGNRLRGEGATGLGLDGSGTVALNNRITGFSIGISVTGAGSRVERNTIVRGHTGITIGSTSGAALIRNRIRYPQSDGIVVPGSASDALLTLNLVTGSETDDGIEVDSASTTLTRNEANRNADLGIEAVSGVTDGGGNRARRNGNPLQCTGVTCR